MLKNSEENVKSDKCEIKAIDNNFVASLRNKLEESNKKKKNEVESDVEVFEERIIEN